MSIRYIILILSTFLFMTVSSAYGFLPSKSGSSTLIDVEEEAVKKNSDENSAKTLTKQQKKVGRQSKRQFKKAVRRAIFKAYTSKLFKKKTTNKNSPKGNKASLISVIALIAGIAFLVSSLALIVASSVFSVVLSEVVGYLILGSAFTGFLTGIIGIVTNDKEKYDTTKTIVFSLVGISSALILIAFLALLIIGLNRNL